VKRRFLVPLTAAAAALAVAGCGSSNDNKSNSSTAASTPPPTQTQTATTPAPSGGAGAGGALKLSADPGGQLKFDKSSLTAKAGKVTFAMDNPSSIPHAIAVEGKGVDQNGKTVGKGGVSNLSVDLKPGKYTFYCPVDGHKDAGMKGTLTVK
jgi:uncharacterized cupredoxin-like copper-binding protein